MSTATELEILGQRCSLGVQLGEGGMGRVYRVDHPHGTLAVKLLSPRAATEPGMVMRLFGEAMAARRVTHPCVVRIVDEGWTPDGKPFIAMLHVPGDPLGTAIQRGGPLSLAQIRAVGTRLLRGLAAIHRAGLVHADVKSDNVLAELGADARATIIDFGLARSASSALLPGHIVSGTPDYMAPEVIGGSPATRAADVYGVGVIFYEMLTGTTPFAGATTQQVFDGHLRDAVVPPTRRCPDRIIPAALERLVMRMLEKNPHARPSDTELLGVEVARVTPTLREPVSPPSTAFSTSAPTRDWLPRRHVAC